MLLQNKSDAAVAPTQLTDSCSRVTHLAAAKPNSPPAYLKVLCVALTSQSLVAAPVFGLADTRPYPLAKYIARVQRYQGNCCTMSKSMCVWVLWCCAVGCSTTEMYATLSYVAAGW